MRLFEETDQRFIGIQKKVGLFIILAIIGIVSVAALAGYKQGYFTPKSRVFFLTDSGRDISPGMPVKLSGFVIGKVKSSSLEGVGKVRVEMLINKEYIRWIKVDSKARLIKEGLIGEGVIELSPGSENAPHIQSEGILPFERESGLSEMAGELKDEIKPMLSDIRQIVNYANNDPKGNIRVTLSNLSRLSDELLSTRKNLDGLIDSVGSDVNKVAKKIDDALSSVNTAVEELKSLIGHTDSGISNVITKADRSLENIQKMTEDLKQAIGQAAPKVPALVETGTEAAEGAKQVIDSVKGIWPISSGVESPQEKTLRVDSVEK